MCRDARRNSNLDSIFKLKLMTIVLRRPVLRLELRALKNALRLAMRARGESLKV